MVLRHDERIRLLDRYDGDVICKELTSCLVAV